MARRTSAFGRALARATRLGIGAQVPDTEAKFITLANAATYVSLLVNVPALPLVWKVGSPLWTASMAAWFACGGICLWFRSHGWHWLATTFLLATGFIWIGVATWIFGIGQLSQLYFGILLVVSFFVYPPAHSRTMWVVAVVSGAAFVLAPFVGPSVPQLLLGEDALADRISNVVGLTAMLGVVVYYERRVVDRAETKLAEERARAETSLKREISRQVAERSRDLSEALARADSGISGTGLRIGDRIDERYRVVALLGSGGMGCVYEVERVSDAQRFALKAVAGTITSTQAARFAREAEIGARLQHENLISIIDIGTGRGVPYLVMELMAGGSLEDRRGEFGRAAWALDVLRQVAAGLSTLHEFGVVHRDLKPSNVLLSSDASPVLRAKIADFGISRLSDSSAGGIDPHVATLAAAARDPRDLTNTNAILGTLKYMAPEAAGGGRAVEAPADVFALGIIGYEVLCGKYPFKALPAVLATANEPLENITVHAGELPTPAVREIIQACLATDPAARPRAAQVLDVLRAAPR
jgi:tRNA A-37 threonylcarbamoyl transferase component Bud32